MIAFSTGSRAPFRYSALTISATSSSKAAEDDTPAPRNTVLSVQAVKPVPPGADNLHRFIAELSGNHMALLLMDTLMRVVGEKTCLVDFTAEEKKAFMKQHEDIVNAIIAGSAEEARRASEAHIRAVYAIHHRQAGREKGAF